MAFNPNKSRIFVQILELGKKISLNQEILL